MVKKKIRPVMVLIDVVVILLLLATCLGIVVDMAFSKVSNVVGEAVSGEAIQIPVVGEDNLIVEGESLSVVLNAEIIKELEAKIPIADKVEILALLAQSLNPEDYKTLMSYAAGDINNETFSAAYNLMREKLGPQEKEIIKSYYAKYIHLLEQ